MVKEISQDQQKLVDRKQAATKLGVTIRTIDRYIRSGKLPKQEIAGRIFIPLKDVNKFAFFRPQDLESSSDSDLKPSKLPTQQTPKTDDSSAPNQKNDNQVATIDQSRSNEQSEPSEKLQPHEPKEAKAKPTTTHPQESQTPASISPYKNLFEELQQELKEKQERLEGANYRVGQLEAQLRETVPVQEFKKALAEQNARRDQLEQNLLEFRQNGQEMQAQIQEQLQSNQLLNQEVLRLRLIKNIFLTILLLLFLLQPLWLLMPPQ